MGRKATTWINCLPPPVDAKWSVFTLYNCCLSCIDDFPLLAHASRVQLKTLAKIN